MTEMSTNDAMPVTTAEPTTGRAWATKQAVARAIEIEDLAAVIREVGGDIMGAAPLAEALSDRGVTFRPGRYSSETPAPTTVR